LSAPGAARDIVDVAVGVLIDRAGRFLLTLRSPGKVYAGWWEFPGGKLESGETVVAAPARELHEELASRCSRPNPGIRRASTSRTLACACTFQGPAWRGEFEMREGQAMAWQTLPVTVAPVLPARFRCSIGLPPSEDVGPTCVQEAAATLKK
jgi:8-oxo-dGTP diphosphatase